MQLMFSMLLPCINNKYTPQMPQICYILKLVHVQIWGNYVSIYTLYELTAINSVTTSNNIHTFHINGICPWTNMLATLHIYILLHVYCTTHTDLALLHISVKNKIHKIYLQFTMLLSYVPATHMPLKHIYATFPYYSVCINEDIMLIYMQNMNCLL